MNGFAGLGQVRGVGGIAGELQSEIGFARGVELRGAAGIDTPAAIGQLASADVVGELGDALGIGFTQDVQVIDVVGFEGGVGFEFALPETLPGLEERRWFAPRSMDFSRRSTQSCCCKGTGAGATETSSPIRANDAISAPPRAGLPAGARTDLSSAPQT